MATKSNKTTETTLVVGQVNTAPQMLQVLEKELKSLVKKSETPFKTNGNLTLGGRTVDIKTETKIAQLIACMASIETQENAYNAAAEGRLKASLGDTFPAFSISGGTADDWAHDINLRIDVISYSERKKELEDLVNEGREFLSKEDQFQMYLQKVSAKFGQQG